MIRKPITIQFSNGLEARPIAMLVQTASRYESSVYIEVDNKRVNAKSIMGMMTLGIDNGENVTVAIDGEDETQAMDAIENYLTGRH